MAPSLIMRVGEVTRVPVEDEDVFEVEWKIPVFLSLPQTVGTSYASPDFTFEDESWYLVMCRNDSAGFINLRFYRVSSHGPPIKVKVLFAFKTVKDKKDKRRYKTTVFQGKSRYVTVRYMPKYEFEEKQAKFMASTSLTVVCTLTRMTSTEKASVSATAVCPYNEGSPDVATTSSCVNESINDAESFPLNDLQNRQVAIVKGDGATAGCSYSKRSLDIDSIPSCKNKFMNESVNFQECLSLLNLLKSQMESVKGVSATAVCPYNGGTPDVATTSSCVNESINVAESFPLNDLQNRQVAIVKEDGATAGCSYSKRNLDDAADSSCKKMCMDESIQVPEYFPFIDSQNSEMAIVKEEQPETTTEHHSSQESQISPDSEVSLHLEALSRDLSKLLNNGSNYDVRITCEGKTFNAHRIILGMRSTVFAAMFENNMVEGETGLIKVENVSASILESFLRYLYCGTLPEINGETAIQFYEIADKYAIEDLKQTCSEFLAKNLSKDNACEILVVADQHNDEDFRKNIISYIVEENIPQHDCWLDFSKSFPILAVEVLNLYVRRNRSNLIL